MGRPSDGYKLADGTKVPSVTEVIGRFKDSAALIAWANKIGLAGQKQSDVLKSAGATGRDLHALIEARLLGKTVDTEPAAGSELARVWNAWRFWYDTTPMIDVVTELSLVSAALLTGGTIDCVFRPADGVLTVADWKSAGGFYVDHILQLAAYRELYNECSTRDVSIERGLIIRLDKDSGKYETRAFSAAQLDVAAEMFWHLRAAWDLDAELKDMLPKPVRRRMRGA